MVLGATGMAGHVIATFFEEKGVYDVFNLSHRKKLNERSYLMDVSDFPRFDAFLNTQRFDAIINCIGILNQFASAFKDKAILLNSYLPHFLEYKYKGTMTKIIHLSTDCVFSGKIGSYTETAFKDGDTFYDRTKAIGELYDNSNLTFRTSIIGPDMNIDGIGLFNWFMKAEGNIQGYINSIWTGITTVELAKAIERAITDDISGIYHLVPSKTINKYELLLLFKNVFQRDSIHIHPYSNDMTDKSLINTRCDFAYEIPDYKIMINEMKEWILCHSSYYSHYTVQSSNSSKNPAWSS